MWQNSIGKVQEGFLEEDYFKRERGMNLEKGEKASLGKRGQPREQNQFNMPRERTFISVLPEYKVQGRQW